METTVKISPLEAFMKLPDGPPYYELINGELSLMPSPTYFHQKILAKLFATLNAFIVHHKLGDVLFAPLDVILGYENVCQPDLLFIAKDRVETLINDKGKINGAPDWVCEILSPSNAQQDTLIKKNVYFQAGILEYWIIDPENQAIEVLTRADTGYKTHCYVHKEGKISSPLFPEWNVKAEELFA